MVSSIKVSKVFVVCLPERKVQVEQELQKQKIQYVIFPAIRDEQEGAMGLLRTMRKLFAHADAQDYKNIIVYEDDVQFTNMLEPMLTACLAQLPPDFLLFYLGCNLCNRPKYYSENLLKIDRALASHAVCYSAEAIGLMNNLLNNEDIDGEPFDRLLKNYVQPLGRCFAARPLLAVQQYGYSFIQKKDVQYDLRLRYIRYTNHIRQSL